MEIIKSVLFFILLITVVIGVHEWGHYIAARLCGVGVKRFSIGFGKPVLKGVDKNGTVWALGWLPVGGFVEMLSANECDESDKEKAFESKSFLQKSFISLAGPVMNLVLGFVLFFIIGGMAVSVLGPYVNVRDNSMAQQLNIPNKAKIIKINGTDINSYSQISDELLAAAGSPHVDITYSPFDSKKEYVVSADLSSIMFDVKKEGPSSKMGFEPVKIVPVNQLAKVVSGSPAEKAGLKAGDVIKEVQGVKVGDWDEVGAAITLIRSKHDAGAEQESGASFTVAVYRSNVDSIINLTVEIPQKGASVGIYPTLLNNEPELRRPLERSIGGMLSFAYEQTASSATMFYGVMKKMILGDVSINLIAGPVTVAMASGDSASYGIGPFLFLMAMVSLSVCFFNLLPVPMLDGGQFLMHTYEAVVGQRPSEMALKIAVAVSLAFIIAMTGLGLFNDFSNFVSNL